MILKLTVPDLSLGEIDKLQQVARQLGLPDHFAPVLEGEGTSNAQWVIPFPEDLLGQLLNRVTLGGRRPTRGDGDGA